MTLTFRSCVFRDNQSGRVAERTGVNGGGLCVEAGIDIDEITLVIEDCSFINNSSGANGGGAMVRMLEMGQATITRCTFLGNRSDGTSYNAGGLCCSGNGTMLVTQTIVAFSADGCGVKTYDDGAVFECCDIYENPEGDWDHYTIFDQWGRSGNFSGHPGFCDTLNGDYRIYSSSPCAPDDALGCGLIGAHGVGCEAETYLVRADGTGDFPTIQAAVDYAQDGDTIELAGGTFSGEGNWDISVLGKSITIRSASGDPSHCVIDCEDASSHIGFRISNTEGTSPNVVLEGITLQHGVFTAVLCYGTVSMVVDQCVFYRNEASGDCGGGISLFGDPAAAAEVRRCTFVENSVSSSGTAGVCI